MPTTQPAAPHVPRTVAEIVRRNENSYIYGTTTHSEYVQHSMYETIQKIDAYLNSKHTSGNVDSLGREKPFFNIVTAAVNIWYRATDIDRKDMRVKATKSKDTLPAFLATAVLQDWMKRENFGTFLNEWGRSLARYGSSVVKFVVKDGTLYPMVMPWNRMIVDSVAFDDSPKIEILELNEAQLRQRRGYDPVMVENLCNALSARQTQNKARKDTLNDFIRLYEVHGMLPLATLKMSRNEEYTQADCENYVQQMHVISFVAGKNKGQYDDYTVMCGKEAKDPYMLTHLIEEDGQTLSIGAVQHLFEAQWMVNHTAKAIKDQLDIASKLIFQTADQNFVGANALLAIEQGDIMTHQPNMPLSQVPNNSHDITSLQSFQQSWKALAQDITSTTDAISGNSMPSGTAYRQVAILNQESHSLFEMMIENKGLALEDMLRRYVIPYLKKAKLANSKEISAILDDYGVKQIEDMYVKSEVVKRMNGHAFQQALNGQPPSQTPGQVQGDVQGELQGGGNARFFTPDDIGDVQWKDVLKDIEWEVEVDITDETSNKEATLTTLTTVLQTIAANPSVLSDPTAKMLFNKILLAAGEVSPLELANLPPTPPPAPPVAPGTSAALPPGLLPAGAFPPLGAPKPVPTG